MKVENVYTSIACNRTAECADWNKNGLIVYGAFNAIAIYDPQFDGNSAKIISTHVQHTKRVNSVRWLNSHKSSLENYIVSGGDDGLVIFWTLNTQCDSSNFIIMKEHKDSVQSVDGLQLANGDWLLASTSADNTIKLWLNSKCMQTIKISTGFSFTVRLSKTPHTEHVLLAFSKDDETATLWAQTDKQSTDFQAIYTLTGHEDWIRSMDFINQDKDLLLATASQDQFIRLWRISPRSSDEVCKNDKVLDFKLLDEIRVEEKIVQLGENEWYAITLESVLSGHEGWVYGVHWHYSEERGLNLLSASIDKSLIVWAASEQGTWMEKVRVGEVGGNSLGFFGGKFSPDGKTIMGHSYQGGFHMWSESAEQAYWQPRVVTGGHFGQVRDVAWEPTGKYLMSVSADQTSRIHGPWVRDSGSQTTWHEIARPQVHGYDMQTLAILSRYKFASGAEEKIVRTFQATSNFIENFRNLTKLANDAEGDVLLQKLPKGASVPSLGLSNKAVFEVETAEVTTKHIKDEYPENYFVPVSLSQPPEEEILMQNTLWPEMQKLYGHGYELYALASSADGKLLASACRATTAEHAQIILWSAHNWKQIQKLASHQLTVTQLQFSPNGQYLLSVSRDRRWTLFERQANMTFNLCANLPDKNGIHTRIIWSCDWTSDSQSFVTTSRDGKAAMWRKSEGEVEAPLNGWQAVSVLQLKNESLTAVAVAPRRGNDTYELVALGFESGKIHCYACKENTWSLLMELNHNQAHHSAVKRLRFRPLTDDSQETSNLYLASCGEDHLVRIHKIYT